MLISRRERSATGPARELDRRGILLAVLSAAAFGLFLVALDYGGRAEPLYTVTTARTTAVLTLFAIAAVTRPAIRLRRRAVPALLVVGLLIAAANLLFTSATTYGYLSVVGVLGWLNPAVTMLWAAIVLRRTAQAAAVARGPPGVPRHRPPDAGLTRLAPVGMALVHRRRVRSPL